MTPELFRKLSALGLSNDQMAGVLEVMEAEAEGRKSKARARWHKWKASQPDTNVSQRLQTSANVSSPLAGGEDNLPTSKISGKQENKSETRDRQFDQLWAVYPRKTGKAPSRKAFDAALKLADFPTILAGAERYAEERAGQDSQYTKHATTWLHGQHWQDEPEPPRQMQPRAASPPKPPTIASMWRDEGRKLGILDDPANSTDRRLEDRLARGPDQSSNPARRITLAGG
jgi:hypothetical protein